MKRKLAIAVLSLAAIFLLVYAGDYAVLRYRIAKNRNPFGSVTVYPYYAVEEKNHKTEFVPENAETDTCVRSLFPHLGYSPCWYLSRHTEKATEI